MCYKCENKCPCVDCELIRDQERRDRQETAELGDDSYGAFLGYN